MSWICGMTLLCILNYCIQYDTSKHRQYFHSFTYTPCINISAKAISDNAFIIYSFILITPFFLVKRNRNMIIGTNKTGRPTVVLLYHSPYFSYRWFSSISSCCAEITSQNSGAVIHLNIFLITFPPSVILPWWICKIRNCHASSCWKEPSLTERF